jgi:hypothetical protein
MLGMIQTDSEIEGRVIVAKNTEDLDYFLEIAQGDPDE